LLYVGDCKMGALETRAVTQTGGDFYLCPLSATQLPASELETYLAPVWTGEQPLTPIEREQADGTKQQIAEGYERLVTLTAIVNGQLVTWVERRLVVRSLMQAHAGECRLRDRLAKAQAAIEALNAPRRGKRRYREATPLRQAVDAVLSQYQVEGLLTVTVAETVRERPVRRYGQRPATVRVQRTFSVTAVVDEAALHRALERLGWRVIATNQPADQLPLAQAVLAYREEYLIERGFGRLKGHPLSLTPMYPLREDHATGLIRLLSIGLRVLTLLEFEARRRLATAGAPLTGVYAGNPKRATAQPTAERLLEAFREITLTVIQTAEWSYRHLTPLSVVQQRILTLLGFSPDLYRRLCADFSKPP
jgi:transposase